MVCTGFEPGTAELNAQTNPLSYGVPLQIKSQFKISQIKLLSLLLLPISVQEFKKDIFPSFLASESIESLTL